MTTADPLAHPSPEYREREPGARVTWLDLLAVFIVTAAVFIPVLHGQFSPLDDVAMISVNPAVTTPTWENFVGFWSAPAFRIYMPLTLSVWQGIAALFHVGGPMSDGTYEVTPMAFKAVSILAHAAAAASAAWTLSAITRTRWPAVLGAMAFALHPTQVESVAWTTGLKDVLCGLFAILSIGLYARHARRNPLSPWRDGWWWATLLCVLLSMASKSTGAVLPAVLLAVDWAVRRCTVARRVVSVAPLMLPAFASVLIIVGSQGDSRGSAVPVWQRPLVAADAYAFYLRKVVWPLPLSIDYGRRPSVVVAGGSLWWTWVAPAVALVGVLLTRSRTWVLVAVMFVVPVLPVSGLATFDMQQYSTVADHYLYQSLLAVGLAVALLAAWRPAIAGIVMAVVCAFAVLSYRECAVWQSVEGLYAGVLRANPQSWMARNLLGTLAAERGDLFFARRMAEESYATRRDDGVTLDLISETATLAGDFRRAADYGIKATDKLQIKRLTTARRLTMLGLRLKDRDVTEKGLRFWLEAEPTNAYVVNMIAAIERSKREDRRAAATTRSGTTAP